MGILDRIFGSDKAPKQGQATQQHGQAADDQAIARYRYLLKTGAAGGYSCRSAFFSR